MRVMGGRATSWVIAALACAAAPAHAAHDQTPPTPAQVAEAKRDYVQGSRLYDLAEYDQALRAFRAAYQLVDDPAFLFNIGQCHRRLGHTREALTFFRTFLRRSPDSKNRADVERWIAALESAAPDGPGPVPPPPPPDAVTETPASGSPTRTATATQHDAVDLTLRSRDRNSAVAPAGDASAGRESPRFYRRAWFWVALGVVALGAAAAAAFALRSDAGGPFCPDCAATTGVSPR